MKIKDTGTRKIERSKTKAWSSQHGWSTIKQSREPTYAVYSWCRSEFQLASRSASPATVVDVASSVVTLYTSASDICTGDINRPTTDITRQT